MNNYSKSIVLQELEVLENFLQESPEEEIIDAANYIFDRVRLNIKRIQYSHEQNLVTRFGAVLSTVKRYLVQPTQEQIRQFYDNNKQETFAKIPLIKPLESKNSPRYIISLTSYGKRLADTAPYAIITLLDQSVKPDKILLWVSHEDKGAIPDVLYKLTEKNLEIRFCADIKSYKKLIYALQEYPDDYIITADDDVYYPQNWFEQLLVQHKINPKKIICHRAHGIKVDINHNPLPYSVWDNCICPSIYFAQIFVSQKQSISSHQPEAVFPTGVSGILYPPNCLYKETINKELFMKLAPNADDIWFWAMAIINKEYFGHESPYIVIENGYSQNLQDIEPEQTQGGNALWNYNSQGGNDIQLKSVIEKFSEIREVLRKITPSVDSENLFAIIPPDIHSGKTIYISEPSGMEIFDSANFWEKRYASGGNSGAGSYNRLAQFKAEIINDFVKKHSVNSVIEFGCGDGNQLSLAKYPKYLGFDVSQTAVTICKDKFSNDKTKEFRLVSDYCREKAELVLSLDVIYHLIENNVFEKYMETLFFASKKYVIIYASNKTGSQWAHHVKHRKFTDWIESNKKDWNLLQFIPNKYPAADNGEDPTTSFADFYVFVNFNKAITWSNDI